ncbi:MAG: hypothetical protein Q8916_13445 [Bacteroidota bacterium]|nr:hypothetical protein [Bacteroidota bacterium]MDP4231398.1 hypothetical protein [Bacteroidota bacterium]
MKRLLIFGFLVVFASAANAQFRPGTGVGNDEKPASTLEAMSSHGDDFFSRLFDPARFNMHQTYSMSFVSGGGQSTGLGVFTNTFAYKASEDLFISADLSAVYSPFSTLGSKFQQSINGVYLSSARLDWKLGDHTSLRIEYNGMPYGSYYSTFDSYNSPFSILH